MATRWKLNVFVALTLVCGMYGSSIAHGAGAPAEVAPPVLTQKDAISGTMDIKFETRTKKDHTGTYGADAPALGAQDIYILNLNVAQTTDFSGTIKRSPRLAKREKTEKGDTKETVVQRRALTFDVGLAVRNPKNPAEKKDIGKWLGTVPIDGRGEYHLETAKGESRAPLRISIDSAGAAPAFEDDFGGVMQGKAGNASKYKKVRYTRRLHGKLVTVTAQKIDPLTFIDLKLASGPAQVYPTTTVNGHFDYDYDSANWYLDNLSFKYTKDGHIYEDRVSGTIKWIEDPDRKTNGKGHYDFNLRFNEPTGPATEEGAAFDDASAGAASGEDAFFAVDESMPSMTGRVEYIDKMVPGKEAPVSSKIAYHLDANKLTKQQIVNFFKLWTIAVGPINDE